MKLTITFISCLICIHLFACSKKSNEVKSIFDNVLITDSMKLKINVGTKTFTATLYDNPTVAAFRSRLPMTIDMKELNGNEKYFDLPAKLPANASNPATIRAGDLMLYGSNTLVLFYKSFSTSYSYTPLGRVDDASGLAAALGSANISVTFAESK